MRTPPSDLATFILSDDSLLEQLKRLKKTPDTLRAYLARPLGQGEAQWLHTHVRHVDSYLLKSLASKSYNSKRQKILSIILNHLSTERLEHGDLLATLLNNPKLSKWIINNRRLSHILIKKILAIEHLHHKDEEGSSIAEQLLTSTLGHALLRRSSKLRQKIDLKEIVPSFDNSTGAPSKPSDTHPHINAAHSISNVASPIFWAGYLKIDAGARSAVMEGLSFKRIFSLLFKEGFSLWHTLSLLKDKLITQLFSKGAEPQPHLEGTVGRPVHAEDLEGRAQPGHLEPGPGSNRPTLDSEHRFGA